MIKVLAIGNSFSNDAMAFLHQIGEGGGVDLKCVNLYIGGCPLALHWYNIENDKADYLHETNGRSDERMSSIKEALLEDEWDYITLQQASHDSGLEETYYPYIENIYNYVKEYCPKAEILIHQTWAYEIDSDHGGFLRYDRDQKKMYEALSSCYRNAAEKLGVKVIPCGDAIQKAREIPEFDYKNGGRSLNRDGFHMALSLGRYLIGAVWFETLTGKSIMDNTFRPYQECEKTTEHEIELLKKVAHETVLAERNR